MTNMIKYTTGLTRATAMADQAKQLTLDDLGEVNGGLIFGPPLVAYAYGGAKAAVATVGFQIGAAWEFYQYLSGE